MTTDIRLPEFIATAEARRQFQSSCCDGSDPLSREILRLQRQHNCDLFEAMRRQLLEVLAKQQGSV